jgi:hypothetical protein
VQLKRLTIPGLLHVLADRLHARGVDGKITVAGGAALMLAYGLDRTTKDIDGVYQPEEAIDAVAREMTCERDLELNWLNMGVRWFLPAGAPTVRYAAPKGLTIDVVAPDCLLAMKILASRKDSSDYSDTEYLARMLGIKSESEAFDLVRRYFPEKEVPARAHENLGEAFGRIREESGPRLK